MGMIAKAGAWFGGEWGKVIKGNKACCPGQVSPHLVLHLPFYCVLDSTQPEMAKIVHHLCHHSSLTPGALVQQKR
jgi:hypothetical protein